MTQFRPGVFAKCLGTSFLAAVLIACGNSTSPSVPTGGVGALNGNYVFTVTGTSSVDGDYAVTGSFVADGSGHITSAVADYNLGAGIDDDVPLTGTYTAGPAVATITLTDGFGTQDSFTTTLVASGSAPIENFDGGGSGTLYKQVTSGFSPAGTYSFSVAGEGQGTVTGSGQFVAGTGGTFTSGTLNFTDAQTSQSYSSVTGFLYPPETGGRGQASLEGNNLAYYVIGPNQIQMIGLDERYLLTIPAKKQ